MKAEDPGVRLLTAELKFTPKTYDIDYSHHVSNISYVRWMEDLRLEWLERYYPFSKGAAQGIAPALLRTEIDYIKQIKFGEAVDGQMWMGGGSGIRWTLKIEFTVNGEVRARASQVGIWFRPSDGKPVRPPAELAATIQEALASVKPSEENS